MLALAITTRSHHAAHVPAGRGEAIVTRNLTGIFATDVLAPAPRGLKKPADLREDLLVWETSILLGPIYSCDYHFPSVGQHGEPAAEKTAGSEPPADSPRIENQATRRATNTEPDRRASVTFLFSCAFMLAALSLAACRGPLRGRKEKKSMHGRTRAAGAAEQLRSLIEEATADLSVYLAPGDVEIIGSTVTDCSAAYYGGVVYAWNSGAVSIIDSTVTSCSAGQYGGVVYAYINSGAVSITNSTVSSCWAGGLGGVVSSLDSGAVSITDSTVRNCSAVVYGGVVYAEDSGAVSIIAIINSAVTGCSAGQWGGVVYAQGNKFLSIAGVTFIDNSASIASVLFLSDIDHRSSISNASFTSKIADNGITIQTLNSEIDWVGLTPKLKILLSFYQVCIVLPTTYSARLPEKYTDWTNALSDVISVDWSDLILPAQCMPYASRLVVFATSPIGLIVLLLLAGVGLRLWRRRAARGGADIGEGEASASAMRIDESRVSASARSWLAEAVLGLLDLTPACLVLIFFFVPSVSVSIFRSWSCHAYTISPPNERLEQVSYMRQDASVECGTDDHGPIKNLAIGFVVVWPVGSLVLYSALLLACHKPLQAKTPNALTRATAFLHQEYELTYFWWEALELARKLVLTGFVLLIPEEEGFRRLMVATVICCFYAVVLAVVRPYKRVEDDCLAVATSLVLLLFFLVANWTTIFLAIKERSGIDDADAVLGIDKLDGVVNGMIVLVAFALLIFLVGAIVAARRVAMVPTIRLVSDRQQPELTLARGHTWHLFNSHIWSTGQDAAAVIKKQLQLLIPDIKIFLDVDDLKSIGALEEYISRSQVVLFFLSLGYFGSKNCEREVRASLDRQKPLVLVQEADPKKGGTLEAPPSSRQAPAHPASDLRAAIFDKGWPMTTWHRIEAFQRALLLCSPNYEALSKEQMRLYVPGEVQREALAFPKPVVLWASPANAGAAELADELTAKFGRSSLTVSTAEEPCSSDSRASRRRSSVLRRSAPRRAGDATHMLLYLNEHTFVSDERLAEQVKQARADRLPIVLVHENDPALGGCPFDYFFQTTPQELIAGLDGHAGLYKALAMSFFPGAHREARPPLAQSPPPTISR
ncbi:hypothetical protein EMIHUDRAFT_196951 [Emiliania huxleyi CCMP1516]|uniref:TIR domain-containing protein n=2 Tax=Emiliania huxleyi TaxID=2903 RepID=A0A0D3ITG5_EMIH1|nr:hypothetical protein EMIHUDRAFT_196951 [Emiliania huxleyi CCMP1516]EOD14550.1 hypothetical protein EMIHUDRAFT_196951 [Emiliania huxleyi CCMP1516]|eukprot:XP_005766979.1 hypothetical protein EMIHUDRAFT_196951 [Emiliania huxleyi CCMP1516]